LELLRHEDRKLVAGIIINKFRGDLSLFQPAIDFIQGKTGIPVLGVIPYFQGFRIQEEDTVSEETVKNSRENSSRDIEIAIIHLPHISNFTDFDPLEDEPDINIRYVGKGTKLGNPDVVIIPGSKNTIEDLAYLKRSGIADEIKELSKTGAMIIGICGGFQILGKELHDPKGSESKIPSIDGLGLLDVVTVFAENKVTTQVRAISCSNHEFLENAKGSEVEGYEIHMGITRLCAGVSPVFEITHRFGLDSCTFDGAANNDASVWGTYIHGVFDCPDFRRAIINSVRVRKGLSPLEGVVSISAWEQRQRDYDHLAEVVRSSLDMDRIYEIIGMKNSKEDQE
jgi:adenosylcobyric acid synthase